MMVNRIGSLIAALVFFLLCPSAEAQDGSQGADPAVQPAEAVAADAPPPAEEQHVLPLFAGDTAPWSGLLVPELQFTEYLQLQLKLDEAQGILEIRTNLLEEQRTIYEQAMRDIARPCVESWWDDNGWLVGTGLGLVVGVGLTVLGVWLAGAY